MRAQPAMTGRQQQHEHGDEGVRDATADVAGGQDGQEAEATEGELEQDGESSLDQPNVETMRGPKPLTV